MTRPLDSYIAIPKDPDWRKKKNRQKKSAVTFKSSPIRQSAEGQCCTLRIPGICKGETETVCLDHVGISGMGCKSVDIHAVYGCLRCHQYIDGGWKQRMHDHFNRTKDTIKSFIFDALIETQLIQYAKGLIIFEMKEENEDA